MKRVLIIICLLTVAVLLASVLLKIRKNKTESITDEAYNEEIRSAFGGEVDTFETKGGQKVSIFSIKHASLAIHADRTWIYADPVTAAAQPATDFTDMPDADLILITHDHFDHLDTTAVKQLSKEGTEIIGNPGAIAVLGTGKAMVNGDCTEASSGIRIEAVPAYNNSGDKLQFHPKGRDNGYILTVDGLRIYIAGDTEDIPELGDIGNIDIAFLPCNLPYTMTPEQCAKAAATIAPKVLFPYHYGSTDIEKTASLLEGSGIDVRIRCYR